MDGLDAADPALEAGREDQLLARIRKDAAAQRARPRHGLGATSRLAARRRRVIAVAVLLRPSAEVPRDVRPQPQATIADARPTPRFELPLEKPDVTLSLKALTWRGASQGNALLADLKQPLDAFRQGDYAQADRDLAALESRYPEAVEIFFYGGVARLFLDDPSKRAIASFERASALADESFAPRIAWYRAVAEAAGWQRRRSPPPARDGAAGAAASGSREACAALAQLGSTPRAPDAR